MMGRSRGQGKGGWSANLVGFGLGLGLVAAADVARRVDEDVIAVYLPYPTLPLPMII